VIPSSLPSVTPSSKPSDDPSVSPSSMRIVHWEQVGLGIDTGLSYHVNVELSSDGSTLAIGCIGKACNYGNLGHTRIYKVNSTVKNGKLTQIGADIVGEARGDVSGHSVSLSRDGLTVAIGAIGNNSNGSSAGHTRIYKRNSTGASVEWIQVGADIDGEVRYDRSGHSVSLSSDGQTVAIGAIGNDSNGSCSGHTRIYKLHSTGVSGQWIQVGADIDGEAFYDWSGHSVSLSSDGLTVAIGAVGSNGNANNSGHTRIYKVNSTGPSGQWIQVGADIDGEARYDGSGHSVSLSSDGLTVAIGAIGSDGNGYSSGHTRVYKFNRTDANEKWIQVGTDIDGGADFDGSGCSVSLSNDGLTVAIGASGSVGDYDYDYEYDYDNDDLSNLGHARIYKLNSIGSSVQWIQVGADIDVEGLQNDSTGSVSLSNNGKIVAVVGRDIRVFKITSDNP